VQASNAPEEADNACEKVLVVIDAFARGREKKMFKMHTLPYE